MKPAHTPTRLITHKAPTRVAESVAPGTFRVVRVVAVLLALSARLSLMALRGATATERARTLRLVFERLGAFWIKTGQLLSMRHDSFSYEFCQELANLQDVAPGASFHQVRPIVEAELGARIEDVFTEFDEAPFAAASIAQLHMARLRTSGIQVAVKIQKPYVAETIRHDLRLVYVVSRVCLALGIMRFYNWGEFYLELDRIVVEELDYRYEAAAMQQMRKTLKAHKVVVPRPYRDLSSVRVLVMEYISGCLLADYFRVREAEPERVKEWNAHNNVDPKKVVRRLMTSHWRQVLEDNLFHCDLHPGNVVLLRDSRIALLDFGSVGHLDATFHESYLRYNQAVAGGNLAQAAELFLLMAPSLPAGDLEQPRREFVRLVRQWTLLSETPGVGGDEKSVSRLLDRIVQLMSRHRIPMAWDILRVNRARISLDASATGLYPDFREIVLFKRYFREARARRLQKFVDPSGMAQRAVEAAVGIGKLIGEGAEAASLEITWMRRRAQTLMLASSKASAILVIGIDLLCVAALGATGGLALLWLHQRGIYRAPAGLSDSFKGVAPLTPGDWALIAVVCVLVLGRLFVARGQIRHTGRTSGSSV